MIRLSIERDLRPWLLTITAMTLVFFALLYVAVEDLTSSSSSAASDGCRNAHQVYTEAGFVTACDPWCETSLRPWTGASSAEPSRTGNFQNAWG